MNHVYREANRATDYLASLGHSLPLSLHVYFQAPIGLLPILLEDARGVALPRVIC